MGKEKHGWIQTQVIRDEDSRFIQRVSLAGAGCWMGVEDGSHPSVLHCKGTHSPPFQTPRGDQCFPPYSQALSSIHLGEGSTWFKWRVEGQVGVLTSLPFLSLVQLYLPASREPGKKARRVEKLPASAGDWNFDPSTSKEC